MITAGKNGAVVHDHWYWEEKSIPTETRLSSHLKHFRFVTEIKLNIYRKIKKKINYPSCKMCELSGQSSLLKSLMGCLGQQTREDTSG